MPAFDPSSVVAVLSVDFQSLDEPLISSIVFDYAPEELADKLDEIRDQLGILEASMVPDVGELDDALEETWGGNRPSASKELAEDLADLDERVGRMNVAWGNEKSGDSTSTGSWNTKTKSSTLGSWSQSTSESQDREIGEGASDWGSDASFDTEIGLLKVLFPNMPVTEVEEALATQVGLEAAIDYLLSIDLIRQDDEHGWPGERLDREEEPFVPAIPKAKKKKKGKGHGSTASTSSSSMSINVVPSGGINKGANPFTKTKLRPPASMTYSSSIAPSQPRPNRGAKSPHSSAFSIATFLRDCVPSQPVDHFLDFFTNPEYATVYSSARASLEALPKHPASPSSPSTDKQYIETRTVLEAMYDVDLSGFYNPWNVSVEEREKFNDLAVCIKVSGLDVSRIIDLMDFLQSLREFQAQEDKAEFVGEPYDAGHLSSDNTRGENGQESGNDANWAKPPVIAPKLAKSVLPGPVARPPPKTAKARKERHIPGAVPSNVPNATDDFGVASPSPGLIRLAPAGGIHPENWQTAAGEKKAKAKHSAISASARPTVQSQGTEYNNSVRQVQVERAKQMTAIRAAGRSFVSGNKAMKRSVMGHYAREAREAGDRIRAIELRNAHQAVAIQHSNSARPTTRNGDRNRNRVIDLHHLYVHEAVAVALENVGKWWTEEKQLRSQGTGAHGRMMIIVGAGNHSVNKVAVIGPAVGKALDEDGWKVNKGETGRGYLLVHGRK
ncbi:hypothetical protein B9479_000776 [Cryptococcus floricola]|uniref:Smr domain-containing protein n=1 Tax=Cryptococcus floricola TaxID=2591691 RepID=A0A5D3B879_9TREE|nr:hypothetical protein B9479_000776 [Cryptococcus floricola]